METLRKEVKHRKNTPKAGETRYAYGYVKFTNWADVDLNALVDHCRETYPGADPEKVATEMVNDGIRAYAAERQDPDRVVGIGRGMTNLSFGTFCKRLNSSEIDEGAKLRLCELYPQFVEQLRAILPPPPKAGKVRR